jgi:excinuclease UvrABC nuclease subunit
MEAASIAHRFETAAKIRDSINGLQRLKKRLKSLYTHFENSQAYLFLRAHNEQCYSLFYIKNGVVLNRIDFPSIDEPSDALLASFISANDEASDTGGNGAHLMTCLLDIRASKYFVPVAGDAHIAQTANDLRQAFKDFITGDY